MFSLWADYRMEKLGIQGLTLGAGGRYVGETNLLDSDRDVPDYFLVDAMARYDFGVIDERLEGTSLTLNARNLFDKEFYTCAGASGCGYGEPTTITATLTKRWGDRASIGARCSGRSPRCRCLGHRPALPWRARRPGLSPSICSPLNCC